jgi:hypothetical protein
LELLGYKHFKVKSPEDDISDVLKTANDFTESFHSTLDSTVLVSDHSTNWELVFKKLRELYPEVQVSAGLVDFFSSFGIDHFTIHKISIVTSTTCTVPVDQDTIPVTSCTWFQIGTPRQSSSV